MNVVGPGTCGDCPRSAADSETIRRKRFRSSLRNSARETPIAEFEQLLGRRSLATNAERSGISTGAETAVASRSLAPWRLSGTNPRHSEELPLLSEIAQSW